VTRRLPSTPPVLAGFSFIRVLGSGGFADVFLYEQNFPRRQVAIKVILSEVVNDHVRSMVQAEANVMAQLSGHPSILTVYQASVSPDGRPYLVMELCSASLSQRYRNDTLTVSEVLAIAIKIGSAIESAHRMGVLHRDIKPSNILTTIYGHPVLSDFGIASTLRESEEQVAVGMSIPWSAPEVVMDETAGTIASEVWSFAATIYSLLAGRSPFEILGKSNSSADLIARINRAKATSTGRIDVPPRLERVLAEAMSKKPGSRMGSIIELLYELQGVESELGLPQTQIEVATDEWATATSGALDERTQIRDVGGRGFSRATSTQVRRRARRGRGPGSGNGLPAAGTVGGQRSSPAPGTERLVSVRHLPNTLMPWALGVASILALTLAATATAFIMGSSEPTIPTVVDISARVTASSIEFQWPDPGVDSGDSYQVSVDGTDVGVQSQAAFIVGAGPGDVVCLSVRVIRASAVGEPSNAKCVEFTGQ
jgi:tRNA A-37 threonylcarbamoyl transferase component Bud32